MGYGYPEAACGYHSHCQVCHRSAVIIIYVVLLSNGRRANRPLSGSRHCCFRFQHPLLMPTPDRCCSCLFGHARCVCYGTRCLSVVLDRYRKVFIRYHIPQKVPVVLFFLTVPLCLHGCGWIVMAVMASLHVWVFPPILSSVLAGRF